jgi:hypothetical protein
MGTEIYSATQSTVMIGPDVIEGLQSIEYKISRSRQDTVAVGKPLRVGIEYGVKIITGKLKVKSRCQMLDEKLSKPDLKDAVFSMQAQLKKDDSDTPQKTIDFQGCYLDDREFEMSVNGVGIAVYTFSATDVLES